VEKELKKRREKKLNNPIAKRGYSYTRLDRIGRGVKNYYGIREGEAVTSIRDPVLILRRKRSGGGIRVEKSGEKKITKEGAGGEAKGEEILFLQFPRRKNRTPGKRTKTSCKTQRVLLIKAISSGEEKKRRKEQRHGVARNGLGANSPFQGF